MSTYNVDWAISRISILLYNMKVQLDIIIITLFPLQYMRWKSKTRTKYFKFSCYMLACKPSLLQRCTQNFFPMWLAMSVLPSKEVQGKQVCRARASKPQCVQQMALRAFPACQLWSAPADWKAISRWSVLGESWSTSSSFTCVLQDFSIVGIKTQ